MSDDDAECPTCGRDDFASEHGMKIHHTAAHGESLAKVTIECDCCGVEFKRFQSELYEQNFCSTECRDKGLERPTGEDHHNWSRKEKVCEWCGDEYSVRKSEAEASRFCSAACKGKVVAEKYLDDGAGLTRDCATCGETFSYSPCEADQRKYCSQACWVESNKNRVEGLICEQCGAEYSRPASEAAKSRFCSQECQSRWIGLNNKKERVETECDGCGDTFQHLPNEERSYCSHSCYIKNHNWLSGAEHPLWEESYNDSYGPNWDDQARKARIRDQARCQLCGLTEAKQQRDRGRKLAVHHIRPIRTFRDGEGFDYERANSLSNLMTVCDRCHQRVEQMAPLRPDTAAAAD